MAQWTLTREVYHEKVYGGWLGRNAGTTLGTPVDAQKTTNALRFYDPLPGQSAASDKMDFQLLWLHTLRQQGPNVTSEQLATAWSEHIAYPWDEYGYAAYNLRRGLAPPTAGAFNNWFKHGLSAAARASLWAMVAPGAPQVAAAYAYRDAILDHAEEGVWSAMFMASMGSAAFFLTDVNQLLDVGLAVIPASCRTARVVRLVRDAFREDATSLEARSRILAAVGHDNFTDTPQNIGFVILGLLYGRGDFGASLCATVNCGYDTDSTGGVLGAQLGIMKGKGGLPQDWIQPLGDSVVLGWGLLHLDVERTVAELTEHTLEAGEQVIAANCPEVQLVEKGAEAPPSFPVEPVPSSPSEPPASDPTAASPTTDTADLPNAGEASHSTFAMPDLAETPDPPLLPAASDAAAVDTVGADTVAADAASTEEVDDEPTVPDANVPADLPDLSSTPPSAHVAAQAPPLGFQPVLQAAPPAEIALPIEEASVIPGESGALSLPSLAPSALNAAPAAWLDNAVLKPLLVASPNTAIYHAGPFEMVVDYGESGPTLLPNVSSKFTVAIRNLGETEFLGHVALSVPTGWQVMVPGAQGQRQMLAKGGMARYGFVVRAPEDAPLQPRNTLTLVLTPEKGVPTTCDIGFLGGSCWWFVGPFQNMGGEGFDKVYPIESSTEFEDEYLGRAKGLVKWEKRAFRETVMDLEPIFAGIAGVAYGVTTLYVPTQTEARIIVHTNDGVKVWLNRQRVFQRHSHETFRPTLGYGPASADVSLRAGANQVLLKATRCDKPLEFAFALTDRDGRPLIDVGNTKW